MVGGGGVFKDPQEWKFQGGRVGGYGYFLEPHNFLFHVWRLGSLSPICIFVNPKENNINEKVL